MGAFSSPMDTEGGAVVGDNWRNADWFQRPYGGLPE
jgi:hypothetical protein